MSVRARHLASLALVPALALALPRCGSSNPPPPATTTTTGAPTSTSSPTTTTAPASTTTTTAPSTTSTTPAPTTPPPTAPPTTLAPTSTSGPTPTVPAGSAFSEDFSNPAAFATRFDHGWSGEVQAGALFGDAAQNWAGDHDMACGEPNGTHRTIHVTPPAGEPGAPAGSRKDVEQVFYPCAPGGDAGKAHVMTSVNTEGYVTAWFSPRQTFTDVTRVCWDINLTDLKGGKWTLVNFLTPAEYQGETDLGYTSPDFAPVNGPSSPQGDAANGIKWFAGGGHVYNDHRMGATVGGATTADKAARFQHCVTDNGNGTLTLTRAQPNGSTLTNLVAGSIPDGPIRVVFVDDSYNPDKHQEPSVARNSSVGYTWHWDNVRVEAAG